MAQGQEHACFQSKHASINKSSILYIKHSIKLFTNTILMLDHYIYSSSSSWLLLFVCTPFSTPSLSSWLSILLEPYVKQTTKFNLISWFHLQLTRYLFSIYFILHRRLTGFIFNIFLQNSFSIFFPVNILHRFLKILSLYILIIFLCDFDCNLFSDFLNSLTY